MNREVVAILLIAASGILFFVIMSVVIVKLLKNREKQKPAGEDEKLFRRVSAAREIVAPDGVDPNPLSYFILNDAGHDVYVRCFTIDALPKRTAFATTFPALFNSGRMRVSVFIEPLPESRAAHMLDTTIVEIETNIISAEKNYNRNMLRKLNGKLRETEGWAERIETGENSLYHSSLPDDEAGFWRCPLSAAEERSLARNGSRVFKLSDLGKYEGFLILEECQGGNGLASEAAECLLWIFQLFWHMCLLAEESEKNYFTDPVTELPGIAVFKREVSRIIDSGQEGYLVVARVPVYLERPYSENSMDCRLQELAEYFREKEGVTAYRIAADMIAILAEGEKGAAIDHMQKIMLLLPETSQFLTSLSFLEKQKIITKIQEEMGKLGEGSTEIETSRPSPRLSVFIKDRKKEDGNGRN